MNISLQAAQKDIADAINLDEAKDAQIALLEKQIAEATTVENKVTIWGIQSVQPETLWYEARSPGAPKTGLHGAVTIKVGEPAVADFHPLNIGGPSDNVYCLRRLYLTLGPDQQA